MRISRFDDRQTIDAIISGLVAQGGDLDELDVRLSLHGPVDLDLLHECLAHRRLTPAAQMGARQAGAR